MVIPNEHWNGRFEFYPDIYHFRPLPQYIRARHEYQKQWIHLFDHYQSHHQFEVTPLDTTVAERFATSLVTTSIDSVLFFRWMHHHLVGAIF